MRASVERRRQEQARKQARREELKGLLGAGLCGLDLGLPFIIYLFIYIISELKERRYKNELLYL